MGKQGVVLKDLIAESKDGEWGHGAPFEASVEMIAVRAADFDDVWIGCPENVPHRHIKQHLAERKQLRTGDIIIECAGGGKDRPTGRTVLLRPGFCSRAPTPITCASFCRFIRIDESKASREYVYWHLQYLYQAGYMRQFHTQHTGVSRFQYTTFATTQRFELPDRPTQRKIAVILSAYDDLIENNTRRIRILEEMAQALYREWFVHFRFPGHRKVKMVRSALGPIPSEWEVTQLGELADINAASIRRREAPEDILYVDIASVSPGRIDKIEPLSFAHAPGRARRIVKHGDIIWSCVRPNRRSYSLILDPPANLIVSTGFAVISAKDAPYTYLYHALTTDDFVAYLTNHATGAAYPAVTAPDFEKARVIRPARVLLQRFHELVEPGLVLEQKLFRKNANLRRTRDLLLPKLISGEVDVSEVDVAMPENDMQNAKE